MMSAWIVDRRVGGVRQRNGGLRESPEAMLSRRRTADSVRNPPVPRRFALRTLLFPLAALASVDWAAAQSIVISPSSTNTLIQVSGSDAQQLSNGQGDVFVGGTTSGIRRGLVAFDVADNVPAGAAVTGVTLTLDDAKGMNGTQTITLSRMLRAWGQGTSFFDGGIGAPAANNDVTWYYTFYNAADPAASPTWAAPGGLAGTDFSASMSASATDAATGMSNQLLSFSSSANPLLITDVQQWLDSPAANFGWIIFGNESAPMTAKRFGGQYATSPESPPQLTIQYNTLPWIWTGGAGNAAWSSSGNWSAGSGSLSGNIAVVLGSSAESGGMVNLLSTSARVSQLTFASAQPVTLTSTAPGGGQLTLDNGSSTIAVTVSSSGDAINAVVAVSLNSDAWITASGSGDSLTIAGNIGDGAASHGIEKDGPGTLVLSGSNTYTGGTEVYGGTLVVASAASITGGTDLTVGTGGAAFFGTQAYSAESGTAIGTSATEATAVPEPGTLLLLAAVLAAMHRTK
jgi:autotransporter-associated beta strand protein